MKKLMMTVVLIALMGCTSQNDASRALAGAGYTDIEYTGYRFTGCSDEDLFHTGFEAIGPSGVRVEGVVCSGILKGATVRID